MVPQVRGRLLGVLQTLLAVRFEFEDKLLVELNEWERNVILYEQQSGEELSGNIKRAVLQQSLPADLRQALQSKTNIDSYADFRAALRDDVLARKAWRSGLVPMEIGAVQERKGGKGKHDKKGKGKGCKHDQKGKHDQGGKGKEISGAETRTETRKCHKCGQVGHIRRDCPTLKVAAIDETTQPTTQPNQVGAVFETAEPAWILALREVRAARTARHGREGMLIDSGVELHVCPQGFHEEFPVVQGQRDIVSISGEPLQYYGERSMQTAISDGSTVMPVSADFCVSDVTAPVLSLEKMVEEGIEFSSQNQRVAGCRRMLWIRRRLSSALSRLVVRSMFMRRK